MKNINTYGSYGKRTDIELPRTRTEMVKSILSDMEYDETIRNGIWKHKTDTYQEFFHHAHGDMLPDDFRYKMIHDILANIDDDCDHIDMLESLIPIYTNELISWLDSSISRLSYCDQYLEEYDEISDTISLLSGGYFEELQEVYSLINDWLEDNTEEEE